jgi:Phytanoyl-CoA dioxygenase (PhyH)
MICSVPASDTAGAIAAMRSDGVVVLRDAVDLRHIALLHDQMLADLPRVLARADRPYNFNTDNVQQSPSRERRYLFRDVLLNDHVIAVTSAMLPGVTNAFYSGNTALPGTKRQPVHADSGHLWSDAVAPAHSIVVNVPLVDMSIANGVTELWPGTHLIPYAVSGGELKVDPALVARQRALRPPEQPEVSAGSILLRDVRLWHAGMPNLSRAPRPMIAMIHNAGWLGAWERPEFLSETRDFFEHPRLTTAATWVDAVDHTALDHAYEVADS